VTTPGRLVGRVALITGASRGIGAAVARRFAAEGAMWSRRAHRRRLEELDDSIRAAGGSATLVPMDLRDYDAIDRLGAALFERYQRLDILVGNAGPARHPHPHRPGQAGGMGGGARRQRHRQLAG